jgi:glycosyltransferase involved in cell wall biosynthesis
MRIGINTLFMIPEHVGGTEIYLRNLLINLAKIDNENEYILFTNKENFGTFGIEQDNFSEVLCNIPARLRPLRMLWEQLVLPLQIKKHNIDILHSPGYVSPLLASCPSVVTIHDMQYYYYPKNFVKARLIYFKIFVPLSAKKATKIITVSNNSKKDIVNILKIPEDKVIVTYAASRSLNRRNLKDEIKRREAMQKYSIEGRYILSVASLLPHKNLDGLIYAFEKIANKIEHQLILVGIKETALKDIQSTLEQVGILKDRIKVLGFVADKDLFYLYSGADLFVLPSLFEGFGLPILEAMSCGCPVMASNVTSIPEIVGEAGLLINPRDIDDISTKMYMILTNDQLKRDLIKRGYERVKTFSWLEMAKKTLKVYKTAFEERSKVRDS